MRLLICLAAAAGQELESSARAKQILGLEALRVIDFGVDLNRFRLKIIENHGKSGLKIRFQTFPSL